MVVSKLKKILNGAESKWSMVVSLFHFGLETARRGGGLGFCRRQVGRIERVIGTELRLISFRRFI
jgi:hypothetical protein